MSQDVLKTKKVKLKEAVIAIGQEHILLSGKEVLDELRLQNLFLWLFEVDTFFEGIGGILGFQKELLALLGPIKEKKAQNVASIPYEPFTLIEDQESFEQGILLQKDLVEIIVLGGAAERLNFVDSLTQNPLPAFLYPFMGKTLLEWLIEEIQAKEAHYFALTGKALVTPIVFMTSQSKNNKSHLRNFLEQHHWFHRPEESFFFLNQPSVPYVDQTGRWVLDPSGNVEKNPCGHGALWNLLLETDFLEAMRGVKKYGLIRQINNPMTAFFGSMPRFVASILKTKAPFSILVTDSLAGAKEGKIVQIASGQFTNIEYIDEEHSSIESFSNVNVFVVDLERIESEIEKNRYPRLILNFKGKEKARAEMSMQNLIDGMEDVSVCYLKRALAIEAIKKEGVGLETRNQAFTHLQAHFLMKFQAGAGSLMFLNPYLSCSADWWIDSKLLPNSFLQLDIIHVSAENCIIEGALVVKSRTKKGGLRMKNVHIRNRGLDHKKSCPAKGNFVFHECVEIVVEDAETYVLENKIITGSQSLRH